MSKKPAQQQGRSRISCTVDNSVLGALVQILADHRVSGIRVEPVDDRPVFEVGVISEGVKFDNMVAVGHSDKRKRKLRGITPTSQTRLGCVVLAYMADQKGPVRSPDVGAHLTTKGFKASSASPCLSDMVAEGALERREYEPRRFEYSLPSRLKA